MILNISFSAEDPLSLLQRKGSAEPGIMAFQSNPFLFILAIHRHLLWLEFGLLPQIHALNARSPAYASILKAVEGAFREYALLSEVGP